MDKTRRINFLFFYLSAFSLLMAGCASRFPAVKDVYISPFDNDTVSTFHFANMAFVPDGQSVVLECGEKVNLKTGMKTYPYENYTGNIPSKRCFINNIGGWSSDGRYLGVASYLYDADAELGSITINYVLDTQNRTVQQVPGEIFWGWSPFNTGNYISRKKDSKGTLGVFNMNDQSLFIPLDGTHEYDFNQYDDIAGVEDVLWSKKLDTPIAELTPLWSGVATNMRWRNLVMRSYYEPTLPGERKYQKTLIDDPKAHIVGAIFDPTGEFVLVAQWECIYTDTEHCSDVKFERPSGSITLPPSHKLDGITDSIFTLIHWRTGESRELFRLSEIDPQNMITSGDLRWSADGSTILVGRIGASYVVLEVK